MAGRATGDPWQVCEAEGSCILSKRFDLMQKKAEELWQLLDNIDTLADACKDDKDAFQKHVLRYARKRHEIVTSDGYKLLWPPELEGVKQ
jgi:hypothetical protein